MVALRTVPPTRTGNGATSVPPPAKLTRNGAFARNSRGDLRSKRVGSVAGTPALPLPRWVIGSMRIAYLVGEYPRVSHAFIRREVEGLRDRGVEVSTFSIRAA